MKNTAENAGAKPAFGPNHNKELKQALADVASRTDSAQNDADLVAAINFLTPFPTPITYDNRRLNIGTAATATSSALAGAAMFYFGLPPVYSAIAAGIAVIALVVYAVMRTSRKSSLNSLSDRIHYQTCLNDYGLKHINVSPKGHARTLGTQFKAFLYGNHSREIETLLRGEYDGAEHSFRYDHYHFHYVNQRIETYTTTDSKGNVRTHTRVVYDHFHRYGFIVDFKYASALRIAEGGLGFFQSGWKTSSISFNENFNVQADSEMEAAKFLTPKIMVEIEDAGRNLGGMELEFSNSGGLCFSFSDSNTLAARRKNGLANPADFAAEIAGHSSQPKLDNALNFIQTLMKYSDNNFG